MKLVTRPFRKGFTLVEVMIAMAILGVIISAIYAAWTAILKSSKSGSDAARETQQSRMVMKVVEQAVAGGLMFAENQMYYSFNSDTTSDLQMISFVSRLPESFPGSGLFPGQPVRRITIGVEPSPTGANSLVMRQESLYDLLDPGQEAYPIVLSPNVSLFTVEFWITNGGTSGWQADWTETNQLPTLVRVGVAASSGVGKASPYVETKVLKFASTTITKDMQVPDPPQSGAGRGGGGRPGGGRPGQGGGGGIGRPGQGGGNGPGGRPGGQGGGGIDRPPGGGNGNPQGRPGQGQGGNGRPGQRP